MAKHQRCHSQEHEAIATAFPKGQDPSPASSINTNVEKNNGRNHRSILGRWRRLPISWRTSICFGVFLLMAIIAVLVIVLLVVVRPHAKASHDQNRPPPIEGGGQTDNSTVWEFSNPPIRLALLTNFPDPALHYDAPSQTWFMFGTNQAAGILQLDRSTQELARVSTGNIQVAESKDFQTWSLAISSSDPLPYAGRWTKQGTTDISSLPYHDSETEKNHTSSGISLAVPRANVWAPEILRRPLDGQFVLYYAAANDTGPVHCIGAAIASSPAGPFTADEAPIICPQGRGGVIDPAIFVDESDNNAIYLVYKIDGNALGHGGECNNQREPIEATPIMLQRMQDDGITVDSRSRAVQILDRTKEDGPLVEAPQIVKAGDHFFLFYSSGCTRQPDYDLRYATSSNLAGPYERHEPALLQTKEFRLTAPGSASIRYAGSPLGGGEEGTTGPGKDVGEGQWKLALHGRINTTLGGVRALFTAGLDFDGTSVSLVDGTSFATES